MCVHTPMPAASPVPTMAGNLVASTTASMPVNKNAQLRFTVLDRCFANRRRQYFIEDLIEACNEALHEYTGSMRGISRRQLLEDIKYMESEQGWAIPLERNKEGRRTWYHYAEPDFSINKRPLNNDEAAQLKEALLTLGRFKGMPQFHWVEELMARLEAGFGLRQGATQVIEFDENPYLKGSEHITPLFHAISDRQVLHVDYQSFKRAVPETHRFHPYYLKQYNNRWFVFGWNEAGEGITNFALDRIHALQPAKGSFRANDTIDFTEYFEDVVGVTVPPGPPETVELRVNPKLWPYIETKPLHGSQKVVARSKEGFTVQLKVKLNYELEALLLSFGEGVEVIRPENLRNSISGRVQELNEQYHGKRKD
jgi:predicted DNA-binding transcriptional regulator YafY